MSRRKAQQGMPRASFANMVDASDGRITVARVTRPRTLTHYVHSHIEGPVCDADTGYQTTDQSEVTCPDCKDELR